MRPWRLGAFSGVLMAIGLAVAIAGVQLRQGEATPDSIEPTSTPFSQQHAKSNHWPVSVKNAGRMLTVSQAPERVVAMSQEDAELMVALGLKERLVGYAWVSPSPEPTKYSRQLDDVPILAENQPSKEVVLAANPDFIIGTMQRARDFWMQVGIKIYEDTYGQTRLPIRDHIFEKIREIARIFGVAGRSRELIRSMQSTIEAIRSRLQGIEDPVNVLILSGSGSAGGTAATFGPDTLYSRLIELAGGVNVFSHLDDSYVQVSWERVIAKHPDVLVLTYCCGQRQRAKQFVASNRALQRMSAVENGRYILIPVMQLSGMMRFLEGLRKLARGFYPARFGAVEAGKSSQRGNHQAAESKK